MSALLLAVLLPAWVDCKTAVLVPVVENEHRYLESGRFGRWCEEGFQPLVEALERLDVPEAQDDSLGDLGEELAEELGVLDQRCRDEESGIRIDEKVVVDISLRLRDCAA